MAKNDKEDSRKLLDEVNGGTNPSSTALAKQAETFYEVNDFKWAYIFAFRAHYMEFDFWKTVRKV
jgi:hypothetical protein